MGSRGTFSSRFIKSGNYQRQSNSDRGSSFGRRQTSERNRRLGGQGASREYFHRWDSDSEHVSFERSRRRGGVYSKHDTHSYINSPRPRYLRGNRQERGIHSLRQYKPRGHGRFSQDERRIFDDEDDEDFLNLNDADDLELQFPLEPVYNSDENDEVFNECKMPFEREISPLIIHRSFEKESLKSDSQERSRSPLDSRRSIGRSRSPLDSRRSIGRSRSPVDSMRYIARSRSPLDSMHYIGRSRSPVDSRRSIGRCRSPLDSMRYIGRSRSPLDSRHSVGRSRTPVDSRRRSSEINFKRHSRRSSFSKRSLSKSPRRSQDRLDRNRKGSVVRSVPSFKTSESKIRSKERELFREEYVESSSLASIRKQIEYEKWRYEYLKRQTGRYKKRSESSVERLLNDCKTSIEMHSESANIPICQTQNSKQSDIEKVCTTVESSSVNANILESAKNDNTESANVNILESEKTDNTKSANVLESEKIDNSESVNVNILESEKIDNTESANVNIIESEKIDTSVQLKKSEQTNNSDDLGSKIPGEKENLTNSNCPEIRPELSPISQDGSFDVVGFSADKKKDQENILNLSPISQVGSYEKREFSDNLENRLELSPISQTGNFEDADMNDKPVENELLLSPISQASSFDKIDKNLELSPISQPGSFENTEFLQDQVFSPISHSGSFENDDLECTPTQKPDNERPNSADSLQKFVEDYRYADGSRSPSPVSSKNSTKNTFPKSVTNNSSLNLDIGIDRYKKEYYYIGNDRVSKDKSNNGNSIRTSYKMTPLQDIYKNRLGSLQSPETKKRKYDAYSTDIQRGSTVDRLKLDYSQAFVQRSKGNNSFPIDKKYQNIFQDKPTFCYSQARASKTTEMFKKDLNKSSFYQDLESKPQSSNSQPPFSALHNTFSRSNQHSYNSINQLNSDNFNRQIQSMQPDIHEVPIKSVPFNEVPVKTNNISLLVNRVAQDRPMNQSYEGLNQELQTHHNPTNSKNYSDSGPNYGLAESLIKNQQYQPIPQMGTQLMPIQNHYEPQTQKIPYNTFTLGPNQSVPNLTSGQFNTNSQNPYQSGLAFQRPVHNIPVNQTVPPWKLSGSNFNNQPSDFGERYRRQNISNTETISHHQRTLGFQNLPFFKEMHPQNHIPLNQGQSYFPQTTQYPQNQVQNVLVDSLLPNRSLVHCLDRPPLQGPYFQPIQSNAGISNAMLTKELTNPTRTPTYQQTPVNQNQSFQIQSFPDYNKPKLPTSNSDRLNQCIGLPLQSNVPPYNVQLAQGQNDYSTNSQTLKGNVGISQTATTNNFLSGPRNVLGMQASTAINNETNPNSEILKQRTCIDLKKYLLGTFKLGYRQALGLDASDCDGNNHLIGDYQPPMCVCFPNPVFTMRFQDTPASPEELGIMFDKFVIFFYVKQNSELEEDPFVIIQDSFSKSDRFGKLNVEEQSQSSYSVTVIQLPHKSRPTCVLRWKGVMLAREDGRTQAEARQKASISLINALAHKCYTVQSKYSYFFGGKIPDFMIETPENPGVYKVIGRYQIITSVREVLQKLRAQGSHFEVKRVDPTHIRVVLNLIEDYFLTEKHSLCELVMGAPTFGPSDLKLISEHVNKYNFLQWRRIQSQNVPTSRRFMQGDFIGGDYIAISRKFTPQELCSHLLATQDNSDRYKLIPPQEPGIDLLMPDGQFNFSINKSIASVHKPVFPIHIEPENKGTFQRSQSFHGGGVGGNWIRFP